MDPMTMSAIIGGGASLLGGIFGQNSNQQMMQQQQSFQQQMSSTAYQRASTDMQAAGLNPMMMFGSGSAASTPSGATPMQSPMTETGSKIGQAISTAVQSKVANATIDNLVAQNAKIKAESLTESERPRLVRSQVEATDAGGNLSHQRANAVKYGLPIVMDEALSAGNRMDMNPDARKALDILGYGGQQASKILAPVGDLAWSAKGVRSLFPKRSTVETSRQGFRGDKHYGDDSFSQRYEGW
ncbi:DNA pilot protein [Blackfly microvirus SF02]|uniref:DNA pilot protein n=1 Tax=Blackfly microvirus SF02 TaxID=2576452 RepID=A0A4P8PJI0_9VIRU|nr:DNA pilot protein [Blackfly microvirus SF02]